MARTIATALAVAFATWLFDGIQISGSTREREVLTLVAVAVIIGVINAFIKPAVTIVSACLVVLTLGLFLLVINALMLMLASWAADQLTLGFHVDGFWTAFFGAIVISIVSAIGYRILEPEKRSRD